MAELMLTRTAGGALVPHSEQDAERIRRYKVGAAIRCNTVEMRNGRFFRKWWALADFAFGLWSETMPQQEYKGQQVQPSKERFRKDLTILAGYYHPVWDIKGDMRVEADSLAWASMDEDTFEALYSATINAVLTKILHNTKLTDADLRAHVERVMAFD